MFMISKFEFKENSWCLINMFFEKDFYGNVEDKKGGDSSRQSGKHTLKSWIPITANMNIKRTVTTTMLPILRNATITHDTTC